MSGRLVAALCLLIAAACHPREAVKARAAQRPVAIVVALVVDQLGAWVADERLAALPPTGGFARLRREGTLFRDVRFAHAATDTAVGHASLFTGRVPREHGVFGNEIATRAHGHTTRSSSLRDDSTRLVGPAGPTELAGSSLALLRVDTFADRFRAAHPDGAIVSISIKERAALFGGGRRPTATLFFESGLDSFATSTAFARALPSWALPHATSEALDRLRATPWEPLDRDFLAAHARQRDDEPAEGDWGGLGRAFPHLFRRGMRPGVFRATPAADEAILALATAALDGERMAERPSLLALSFSTHDYVGHVFGPDSWEAWDELLRLDGALARLFAALDARVGSDGWVAILSADHGGQPLPELPDDKRPWCRAGARDRWERPCGGGVRLLPTKLSDELEAVAVEALGGPAPGGAAWVDGVADPWVFLSPTARALPPARLDRLIARLAAWLSARPGVERVVDVRALPSTCPDGDSLDALVCRSYPPGSRPSLYVVPTPGSFFDPEYTPGFGSSHGTPLLADRAVPLLARAPGRLAAGRVVDDPQPFTRYRALLDALLDELSAPRR